MDVRMKTLRTRPGCHSAPGPMIILCLVYRARGQLGDSIVNARWKPCSFADSNECGRKNAVRTVVSSAYDDRARPSSAVRDRSAARAFVRAAFTVILRLKRARRPCSVPKAAHVPCCNPINRNRLRRPGTVGRFSPRPCTVSVRLRPHERASRPPTPQVLRALTGLGRGAHRNFREMFL